jgi:hypothetical protein
LRPGDAIAQLTFNVTSKTEIRRSTVETHGNIFDKYSQINAHGDDVVITGRILQEVKDVFTSMVEQTSKMRLETDEQEKKL